MTITQHTIVIQPDPAPERFHHTDVDGDRLLVTTADVPGHGPGVYFKTDPAGSTLLLGDLPAFIAQLQVIAEAARNRIEATP